MEEDREEEPVRQGSSRLGADHIIEIFGEDLLDKNLYFICLLCDKTEKHSQLESHFVSTVHRLEFLV